jgi:hypothetical protein
MFTLIAIATPAAGGGSSGGGGTGPTCPSVDQIIETIERGEVLAGTVRVGEHLIGPDGRPKIVFAASRAPAKMMKLTLHDDEALCLDDDHLWKSLPPGRMVRMADLTITTPLVRNDGGFEYPKRIERIDDDEIARLSVDGGEYVFGRRKLIGHNFSIPTQ